MRRIPAGIVFAIIVLLGVGSYSLTLRAQQQAEQALTDAVAALRAALGSGSVGKIEVDPLNRAFKVSDIELQTDVTPRTTFKIRELTATGIDFASDGRLSAERIDALDVEISGSIGLQPVALNAVYKAPRITITGFSGPVTALRPVDTSAAMDAARLVLEHIVASAATSVAIPTLTATMSPSTPGPQPIGPASYTYTGLGMRDIRNGHVAEISIEGTQFAMTTPPELLGKITGEGGRISTADFDAGALAAILSAKTTDDRLLRLQGRSTVGPYALRFENGGGMEIGAIEIDNVGVRPAKLRFAELMTLTQALGPRVGGPASPAELGELFNLMADIYEGIGIGLFEIRGVTLNMPQTPPFRLGTFRMKGFENGKLAEWAVEGVEGQSPQQQPFKIGRIALKGLDFAKLYRVFGQFGPGGAPSPETMASLIPLLEGAEIKDLIAPYKDTRNTVSIETFTVSWGQFVGPIPTAARMTARIAAPLDVGDSDVLKLLAGAGITSATINFDIGAAWTEATSVFALAPLNLEIANLFSLTARVSVGNVPRQLFTVDPVEAMFAAGQVEAGLAEFVLRDAGALDLAIAQFAAQQGLPVQAARTTLIDSINQAAAVLIAGNPELQPAVAAIVRFIETPRRALTVRLIPKGQVPLQAAIEAAAADPTAALSQFRIEVTTGP
jgi:hypothetical protein